MARITAGIFTSHVPAIGAALDLGKSDEPVLAARVRRVRAVEGVASRTQARRGLPRLQRPCNGVQPRLRAHIRHRVRGRVQAGRRGLGRASGAGRPGTPAARDAHRTIGDPGRFRFDRREPHGRRPRADGPDVAHVRSADCLAVPRDSARGQRGAVPSALRAALLSAGPGHPQGGGIGTTRISTCTSGEPGG